MLLKLLLKKAKEISVPLLVMKFTALRPLLGNVLKCHRMTLQVLLVESIRGSSAQQSPLVTLLVLDAVKQQNIILIGFHSLFKSGC